MNLHLWFKTFKNRGALRRSVFAEIIPADLIRIMPAKGGSQIFFTSFSLVILFSLKF